MERRTTPFVPDFSTPERGQGRLNTLSAMTTGAVDGFDSKSCTGACATCPNRGKCSVQQGGAGCTGACATCPNRDKCAAQTAQEGCSGACATCPNRDKCGFKTRLCTHTLSQLSTHTFFTTPWSHTHTLRRAAAEHCPGTNSEQAGHASACEGCPNRKFCQTRNRFEPDEDTLAIRKRLEKVRHTVIVLSGKGGVGKSTFSAQLAFALAGHQLTAEDKARMRRELEQRRHRHPELEGKTAEEVAAIRAQEAEEAADVDAADEWQVGLMDVDICGPSIPTMLGIEDESIHGTSSGMTPAYVSDNLAAVSVGFLLDDADDAVVWRGPKKNGMIKQFLRDVDWGEYGLDWLVVDTPPGTSDEHLSVVQYLKGYADGAIIVTSPQDVALADVRKEVMFCRKVGLRVIGVVENMSGFICPCCHVCCFFLFENNLSFHFSYHLIPMRVCMNMIHRKSRRFSQRQAAVRRRWQRSLVCASWAAFRSIHSLRAPVTRASRTLLHTQTVRPPSSSSSSLTAFLRS